MSKRRRKNSPVKARTIAIFATLFFLALFFLAAFALRDPSPLHVGSTPDEVWSYVRAGRVSGVTRPNYFGIVKTYRWKAVATNVQGETHFRWRTNKIFAIRKTIYDFGTNDSIQRVESKWSFAWPY